MYRNSVNVLLQTVFPHLYGQLVGSDVDFSLEVIQGPGENGSGWTTSIAELEKAGKLEL